MTTAGYTFTSVSTAKPGRLDDLVAIARRPSELMEGKVPDSSPAKSASIASATPSSFGRPSNRRVTCMTTSPPQKVRMTTKVMSI